jgi:hypothetical protein
MRYLLMFLLFTLVSSCSKPNKPKKTVAKKEKKTVVKKVPKLPKTVKLKIVKKLKPVPKKLIEKLETLVASLKTYNGKTINISTVFKKHFKGFKSKDVDFALPAKSKLRVKEIRKDRLYGAMLWIEQVVKPKNKSKNNYKESDEEEPYEEEEIEPFCLFIFVKFQNKKAKIVIQKGESISMENKNAKITFPPFFQYTGAFIVTYEAKESPDMEKIKSDTSTREEGVTHDIMELSNNGIMVFRSFTESIDETSPGNNIGEETSTTWIKSLYTNTVYILMTTVITTEYYNTGEDIDAPPTFHCTRTTNAIAMPLYGSKWKYLKKNEFNKLGKTDPALKKVPKEIKVDTENSCKKTK